SWLAILLGAVVLAPFYDKAFTIDDPVFLWEAEQALKSPLHPTSREVVWNSGRSERLSSAMASGPVMPYLLIPAIWMGGREAVVHASQFLLLVLAVLATASLALRLGLSEREA